MSDNGYLYIPDTVDRTDKTAVETAMGDGSILYWPPGATELCGIEAAGDVFALSPPAKVGALAALISSLFGNDEQGGLWLPGPDTCFTDTAGTTAAGVGDTVAKQMDVSQGGKKEPLRNLLTHTEQFDNAVWTKNHSTVTANAATAPDGTLTADALNANAGTSLQPWVLILNRSFTEGVTYVLSLFAKKNTHDFIQISSSSTASHATFNLATGEAGTVGGGTSAITALADGWYRLTHTFTASSTTTTGTVQFMLPASNAAVRLAPWNPAGTESVYIWGAQLEQAATASDYQKRTTDAIDLFDGQYVPGNHATQATAAAQPALGRTVEGGRRNLLFNTNNPSVTFNALDTSGTGSVAVLTGNYAAAPDGTLTATRLQADRGASNTVSDQSVARVTISGLVNPHDSTISIYAKSNTEAAQNVYFRNQTGSGGSVIDVTTEWQRFDISGTVVSTTDRIQIGSRGTVNTTAAVDVLIWSPQFELGLAVSPYQRVGTTALDVTEAGKPELWYLKDDGVDDALIATFPAALGSTCTTNLVGTSVITSAGQTIGTTYDILQLLTPDVAGAVVTDDALTAGEQAQLAAYLTQRKLPAAPEFILQMQTTGASETITLPMTGTVAVDIDWGDGSAIETFTTASPSHVYATAGTHDIKVTGSCGTFSFNNGADAPKLLHVLNGGTGFVAGSWGSGFYGCTNLVTADFKGLNTSGVTNMFAMFRNCTSLTSLDVSGFNTGNVNTMGFMFNSCSSLTTIDVSGFNTAKVTTMLQMFSSCSSLTTLDVSGFNTVLVGDMRSMFTSCTSLTSDPGIHAFNVTALTNAASMCAVANNMLSETEYNTILVNWEAQAVNDNVAAHFGDATHSGAGSTARAALVLPVIDGGHGWTISDGGAAP